MIEDVTAHCDGALDKDEKTGGRRSLSRLRPRLQSAKCLSLLTILSLSFLALVTFSFKTRQQDCPGCNMSYMYPSYRHLYGFDLEHTRFAPKYSLYLYREETIDLNQEPHGVPVLFVPGNAGSYKQIRPIAAAAAAQFQQSLKADGEMLQQGKRSLDFFTVDFNEDFSAFHGQTMLEQAEYLNSAITYILSLYTDARKSPSDRSLPDPSSVIIIGHSMGGLVARLMQSMPNYLPKSINTILTMSTPHAIPPAPFDPQIQHIYDQINSFWHASFSNFTATNSLEDVSLISIAGGGLDTIVSSDYTSLRTVVPPSNGFTVYTSTIPEVWISADHQAILWCDQFRQVVARTLLEIVDVRRAGQTTPIRQRMAVFRKHLLSRLDLIDQARDLSKSHLTSLKFGRESSGTAHRIVQGRSFYKTSDDPDASALDLIYLHTDAASFQVLSNISPQAESDIAVLHVSLCRRDPFAAELDSDSIDLSCLDITGDLSALPSQEDLAHEGNSNRLYFLQYDRALFEGYEILAIRSMISRVDHFVAAEVSTLELGADVTTKLSMFNLFFGGIRIVLGRANSLMSTVRIDTSVSSMVAFTLSVVPQTCQKSRMPTLTRHFSRVLNEAKYHVGKTKIDISVHGQAPFLPRVPVADQGLTIQHWPDPGCTGAIDLSLNVDYFGSLGKLVMRYRIVVVVFPLAIAFLVLWLQVCIYNDSGTYISYQQGLRYLCRRILPGMLVIVSVTNIALISLQSGIDETTSGDLFSSSMASYYHVQVPNDRFLGLQDYFLWWLAPLFICVSLGLLNVMSILLDGMIRLIGMAITLFRGSSSFTVDKPVQSFKRRLITTVLLLSIVSFFVPYQFAFIVACIVQLITCVRIVRTQDAHHHKAYNFNLTIFILMVCVLPINIPILIVWVRNISIQWFTPFSSHHNILNIAPIVLLVESLTNGRLFPRSSQISGNVLGSILMLMSAITLLYGAMYTYLLHHLLNILAGGVFLYQHYCIYSTRQGAHPSSRKT